MAPPARAGWGSSPGLNLPICTAKGVQSWRGSASDGAGGVLLAWADTRLDSLDVWAQHVDAAGNPLWGPQGLLVCGAPADQDQPAITTDGAGGAIVVWRDQRGGGTGDLRAQRIATDGELLWGDGVIVCDASAEQDNAVVVSDGTPISGTSGAIVAWEDWRATPAIYAQRLSPAGVALWPANGIRLATSAAPQFAPVAVGDRGQSGNFTAGVYVAWLQQGSGYDVVGQHLGADSTRWWGASGLTLCNAPGNQLVPALACDGSEGVTVAWQDYRGGAPAIRAQRVNWWGVPKWTANGVAVCAASTADQTSPVVAGDAAQGAIVAWQDARTTGRVVAQHLDSGGHLAWPAAGVLACDAGGGEAFPALVSDGNSGAILAWEDTRAGVVDLWSQRLGPDGSRRWSSLGRAICTAPGAQYQISLAGGNDSTAVAVWTDQRNSDSDLYGQRLPLIIALDVAPTAVPVALRAGPEPTRGPLALTFTLAAAGEGTLAIFDAGGRRVRTLASGAFGAGPQRLAWDGRDADGRASADGIYFARLVIDTRVLATRRITLRR